MCIRDSLNSDNIPEAILVRYSSKAATLNANTASSVVYQVKSIYDTVNDAPGYELVLYQSGKKVSYTVDENCVYSGDYASFITDMGYKNVEVKDLKRGDVIQVGYGEDNRINTYRVLMRAED